MCADPQVLLLLCCFAFCFFCKAWNLPHGPFASGARHMSLKEASQELANTLSDDDALLTVVSSFLQEPVPSDWRTACP